MAEHKRRRVVVPTETEDAAITAAAESDPDNPPPDDQLARMRPFAAVRPGLVRRRGPRKDPTGVP